MYCMFYKCSSLNELDISNFNINNNNEIITKDAFYGCSYELKEKILAQNKIFYYLLYFDEIDSSLFKLNKYLF